MKHQVNKNLIIAFFAILLIAQTSFALTLNGQKVNFTNLENYAFEKKRSIDQNAYQTILVKTKTPLSKEDKDNLYSIGIESISYAGDLSYFIYGEKGSINRLITNLTIKNSTPIYALASMESKFKSNGYEINLLETMTSEMDLKILLLEEFNRNELEKYFSENNINATIFKVNSRLKNACVKISENDYNKLLNLPIVQFVEKDIQAFTVQ